MPNLLSKLTSCIPRRHPTKNVKPFILSKPRKLFKLSRFELMPDEILFEILEYLPLIDLFHIFVNLNFRINLILRDIRLGVIIRQCEDNNKDLLNALYYFCKQIVYIHIDRYPLLNLKIFSNLRSLIIYLPTKVQLLSICPRLMPHLSRLWLGILNEKDHIILNNILFENEQFSKLRFCNLFQISLINNRNLSKSCQNLRTLLITNCTAKDFVTFLFVLPNLNRLEICISNVFSKSFENLNNYSHKKLRILKIEFLENLPKLNLLNSLISFVPYVQRCSLLLVNLFQIRDYVNLQEILLQKLVELKQFYCSIDYYCQLSSNQMVPKFDRLRIRFPFFETMRVIPCTIHHDKCVRKTWINKTFIHI